MKRMVTSALAAAMLSAVNLQAQTERTTIMKGTSINSFLKGIPFIHV